MRTNPTPNEETILLSRQHITFTGKVELINNRMHEILSEESTRLNQVDLVDDQISTIGKRYRPTLLLVTGESIGLDLTELIDAAAGIELVHDSSLIFDDIIDEEYKRREKLSLHRSYGTGLAIGIGLTLSAIGIKLLLSYEKKEIKELVSQMLVDLSEGATLENKHDTEIAIDDYLIMCTLKSGSVFGIATSIAAALANKYPYETNRFLDMGRLIGLSYQLMDDIVDKRFDKRRLNYQSKFKIPNNIPIHSELSYLLESNYSNSGSSDSSLILRNILRRALKRISELENELISTKHLHAFQSFTKHIFKKVI
ncbi:MAG: polyprenyl synthetase family protein [Candidatus Bathyarchaeia archaeon]